MKLLQLYKQAKANGHTVSIGLNGAGTEKQLCISNLMVERLHGGRTRVMPHPVCIINAKGTVVYGSIDNV